MRDETKNRFAVGNQVRRAVLGDAHVDQRKAAETEFDADFQRYITETAWGDIWRRPGLDRRTRSLITIAMLAAMGRPHELALHIRGGHHTGATREEIKETLMQVAVYAGVPAASAGITIAKRVFLEIDGSNDEVPTRDSI